MKRRSSMLTALLPLVLTAAALAAADGAARADLQIDQTTVVTAPGVSKMLSEIPDSQRGAIQAMVSPLLTGTPWLTTTYLSGQKMRTDMGQTSTIVNGATGHELTLNRATQKYAVGPYNPFQKAAGQFTVHITPTTQTTQMLGHTVQRYALTMTSSVLPSSPISGELWAAPDLPTPPSMNFAGGPAAGFETQLAQVKGMPLAYKLSYANTPGGDITVTSYATQIIDSPLPASVFRIPDGYAPGQVQSATSNPAAGYPLGDGMPLDTGSAGAAAGAPATASGISALGGDTGGMVQQLLGGLTGGGSSSDLSGMVSGLLGGSGGGASGASAGALLQQLSAELKSLTSDE